MCPPYVPARIYGRIHGHKITRLGGNWRFCRSPDLAASSGSAKKPSIWTFSEILSALVASEPPTLVTSPEIANFELSSGSVRVPAPVGPAVSKRN